VYEQGLQPFQYHCTEGIKLSSNLHTELQLEFKILLSFRRRREPALVRTQTQQTIAISL
jgi:hypothetical protein